KTWRRRPPKLFSQGPFFPLSSTRDVWHRRIPRRRDHVWISEGQADGHAKGPVRGNRVDKLLPGRPRALRHKFSDQVEKPPAKDVTSMHRRLPNTGDTS